MEDKLCFVQFLHPGGEHEPDHGDCKHWNIEPKHRRKFLRVPGHYRSDSSEAGHSAEIAFWGEWEPESRVVETYPKDAASMSRWLQEAYWQSPDR